MKKKFIILLTFIIGIIQTYAEEIEYILPEDYVDLISITRPNKNFITTKDEVTITGFASQTIRLFIDEKEVNINNNGTFKQYKKLNTLGHQSIIFRLETENETLRIKRDIIKLKNPKDNIMSQKQLGLLNTDLVSKKTKSDELRNIFKKKDLAFFLNKIKKTDKNLNVEIIDIEKQSYYYTPAKNTVNHKIFNIGIDRKFNPESAVTLLTFLATTCRALNYKIDEENLISVNISNKKWFYDIIQISLQKGLVEINELKKLNQNLNINSFLDYASRIKEIEDDIKNELTFTELFSTINDSPKRSLPKNSQTKKLEIIKQYKLDNHIVIEGKVNPNEAFTVNWKKINRTDSGEFQIKLPKSQEKIEFIFKDQTITKLLNEEKMFTKSKNKKMKKVNLNNENIVPYKDLKDHWVATIANQLKKEKKLDNEENFYPKKIMNRGKFAYFTVNILGLKNDKLKDISFNDVDRKNKNYQAINILASSGYIKGIDAENFGPKLKISKIQAVIIASRFLPEVSENIELPFNDLNNYNWAISDLKKAYYYGIISKNDQFFPNKTITKAEAVTLLYKLSKI